MRGIFKSIKFAWDYIVGGKHRLPKFFDYCNIPGSSPIVEALVDNRPNSELEEKMGTIGWPVSEDYYSVRLFFTIQDAP